MKEANIKLFPVLDRLCGQTTPSTPSTPASFRPDLWTLRGCVGIRDGGADLLLGLPRSGGGLCVRERDVFLRGSHGHRVWTSQRPEAGEEAYCVVLKGRDRDSPTGDIRSFDFSAHLRRLKNTAMEAKAVELVFYSGRRFSMEPERYRAAMETFVLGVWDAPAHSVSPEMRKLWPHDHAGAS